MKKLYLLCLLIICLQISSFAVPLLNSYPAATSVIFLDFDGHYVNSTVWNGGSPLNCVAAAMSDAQITEAFNRTAEDYRPFDINITTDSAVFLAAPLNKRFRVIITSTSGWYQGVGGVAYIGSFSWGDDTPGFVFCDRLGPNSPKMVGEACSHESGHAVGLSHQSKYGTDCVSPIETYNSGVGSGEAGWAPIMGNSYYKNLSNWNNGPTPYGCTNMQDNLSIITTLNGFGYRTDDYTEVTNGTTTSLTAGSFTKSGIITTNTDKDAFRFSVSQNSSFHLTAVPYNVGANYVGANLDIKLQLFNNAGTLISTYDPENTLGVTVDTVLNNGTYYLKIDGSGNTNIGEYGSLGAYTITGTNALLAIDQVTLSGNAASGKHSLNWTIVADEPVQTVTIEAAADAVNFRSLATTPAGNKAFSYSPGSNGTLYYRLKLVELSGKIVYSNTIVLKGVTNNNFKVSTLVQSNITLNASVPCQYQLSDINGKLVTKGAAAQGITNINISNQPNGMYFLQLFSNSQQVTERIIKQ
jgi:hypothetical protein